MAERDIIVIGAGGHARVLIALLRREPGQHIYAVDIDPTLHGTVLDDVPVIGADDLAMARAPETVLLVNGQGNVPGNGKTGLERRRRVFDTFTNRGFTFVPVISPAALISPTASYGDGAQIVTAAVLHPGAKIGRNVIVNTGAQIDHDSRVGDHCHIAPGAIICGGAFIGDECHIGAGAVVNPKIRIGSGATVGSGAVVVRDVAPFSTVYGNPARELASSAGRSTSD